jgi:hypothetical protein
MEADTANDRPDSGEWRGALSHGRFRFMLLVAAIQWKIETLPCSTPLSVAVKNLSREKKTRYEPGFFVLHPSFWGRVMSRRSSRIASNLFDVAQQTPRSSKGKQH